MLEAHRVTSMADTDIDAVKNVYLSSLMMKVLIWTYDMYKSSLRHMHDPVFSSLKMKSIRLLFIFLNPSS
jgi:hypothetical protein